MSKSTKIYITAQELGPDERGPRFFIRQLVEDVWKVCTFHGYSEAKALERFNEVKLTNEIDYNPQLEEETSVSFMTWRKEDNE